MHTMHAQLHQYNFTIGFLVRQAIGFLEREAGYAVFGLNAAFGVTDFTHSFLFRILKAGCLLSYNDVTDELIILIFQNGGETKAPVKCQIIHKDTSQNCKFNFCLFE